MNQERVCGTCRWGIEPAPDAAINQDGAVRFFCRLNPPTVAWADQENAWATILPVVRWYEFCSHWAPRKARR
jgi:hypothetical protein